MRPTRAALGATLLSVVGLGVTGWLAALHLGLQRGEFLGGAVCGGAFDCHTVLASRWSAPFGLPLSHWGFIAYATALALALASATADSVEGARHTLAAAARRLLATLALAMVLVDLGLAYEMLFVVRGFCPFCAASYAINLALLVFAWRMLEVPLARAVGRFPADLILLARGSSAPHGRLVFAVVALAATGALGLHFAARYLTADEHAALPPDFSRWAANQPRLEIATEGDPALGPARSPIEIVLFADFQCPTCRKTTRYLELFEARHRGEVRVVFKNFPLDRACNPQVPRTTFAGSCELAAAGEAAHAQGRFWAFDHALAAAEGARGGGRDIDFDALAARLGLDRARFAADRASPAILAQVSRDVDAAVRAGVVNTPTVFVNGLMVRGPLVPSTFEAYAQALRPPE